MTSWSRRCQSLMSLRIGDLIWNILCAVWISSTCRIREGAGDRWGERELQCVVAGPGRARRHGALAGPEIALGLEPASGVGGREACVRRESGCALLCTCSPRSSRRLSDCATRAWISPAYCGGERREQGCGGVREAGGVGGCHCEERSHHSEWRRVGGEEGGGIITCGGESFSNSMLRLERRRKEKGSHRLKRPSTRVAEGGV